jgi:hypothetical protein
VAIATTIVCIISLITGAIIYQPDQEQQRVAGATQALRNYFIQLAHKPYFAHVPGEHCGFGSFLGLFLFSIGTRLALIVYLFANHP